MLPDKDLVGRGATRPSPHYDCRPDDEKPSLLVVHNISLPPAASLAVRRDQYIVTGTR